MGKYTTIVFVLVVVGNLWPCSNANDLQGCECNIMNACDEHGKPQPNLAQYLPTGVEQFGYVVQVQNLAYLCEDGTVTILFDCNSQIPLYAATVMTGEQLSAASAGERPKRFRVSAKLKRIYQQKGKDYQNSSKRELCYKNKATKKRAVDKKWTSAKKKEVKNTGKATACLPAPDLKAEIHKGHLIASQYGRGKKERMVATFTYTNVVPQFGRFNSGPWQQCESSLIRWGQNNCVVSGAQNVQLFIVVGAVPSTFYGASEARFFGKEGFSDYQQEDDYPVNVPKVMWTAACCTFKYKDDQGNVQNGTRSTAFHRENDPGDSPCNKINIPFLQSFLSQKTNINLFPQNLQCSNPNNYIALKC